jgi:hypothetical protein
MNISIAPFIPGTYNCSRLQGVTRGLPLVRHASPRLRQPRSPPPANSSFPEIQARSAARPLRPGRQPGERRPQNNPSPLSAGGSAFRTCKNDYGHDVVTIRPIFPHPPRPSVASSSNTNVREKVVARMGRSAERAANHGRRPKPYKPLGWKLNAMALVGAALAFISWRHNEATGHFVWVSENYRVTAFNAAAIAGAVIMFIIALVPWDFLNRRFRARERRESQRSQSRHPRES